MAGFTTAIPNSFKVEILSALHNFVTTTGNVFKVALGKAQASLTGTYGAATTNYSDLTGNTDELANGSGYTTGGFAWTAAQNTTPVISTSTAVVTWSVNPNWTSATFTTRGCVLYNSSASNRAAYVGSFGADQAVTAGTLTLVLPTADASNALIRIA